MKKSVEGIKTSKITGGIRHPLKSRRKFQIDRYPSEALMGEQETATRKTRGDNRKTALKTVSHINLVMPDSKTKRTKIVRVLENPTNNDYQRRGVITKGAILETDDGKCKVISRPGQCGVINAILVK